MVHHHNERMYLVLLSSYLSRLYEALPVPALLPQVPQLPDVQLPPVLALRPSLCPQQPRNVDSARSATWCKLDDRKTALTARPSKLSSSLTARPSKLSTSFDGKTVKAVIQDRSANSSTKIHFSPRWNCSVTAYPLSLEVHLFLEDIVL